MPTVVEGIINPYDATTQVKENIVDMIDAIDRREIPFLNLLGWALDGSAVRGVDSLKFPCTQAQHTWQNDELIPNTATLGAAYASGNTTITLSGNVGAYFVEDEIIVASSGGNVTHWRILTVDTSPGTNDILTVEVLNGDAAHINGTRIYSMGRPATRGEQYATEGKVTDITTDTNHTQIFGMGKEGVVSVSGTEQATESWGITDRLEYETAKKLQELAIRMEQAAQFGLRTAAIPTANDQPASRMGGLDYYLRVLSDGNVINANGDQLASNENHIKQMLDDVWDDGGNPSIFMMNTYQRRNFSDFLAPFVRTERTERIHGVVVNQYEYSHGTIGVALNKWTHADKIWVLSMEYIGIGPLKGNGNDRSFAVETLPKTGDYFRRAVGGEYTMEVRARARAHGLIHNLAVA